MIKKRYIPSKEELALAWLIQFLAALADVAPTLGLSAAIVAALTAEANAAIAALQAVLAARNDYASKVATKNTALASATNLITNEVGLIRRLPAYTESIGESLGIIAPTAPFDPNTYQAKILGAINSAPGGQVKLRFNKAFGNIDGVNMYCLTQGQTEWRLLGFRKITPYVDDTPLTTPNTAEVRSYRCFAVINDVEIGLVSDTVTLAVI